MQSWLRTFGVALAISTAYEVIYWLYQRRRKSTGAQNYDELVETAFFPDAAIACEAHFTYGCDNTNCWLSHDKTSSMRIMDLLASASRNLDISVYCIASEILTDAVLKCQSRGVVVRVVTDQAQAREQGSQVKRLRSNGVEVRTNDTSFFMHHKFVVVDQSVVMTGSFNWSRNAMLGNHENVLFIRSATVVSRFQEEFNKLWDKYSPTQSKISR